jgi:hypothetical protein
MKYRPFLFSLLFVLIMGAYRPVGADSVVKSTAGTTLFTQLNPPPYNKSGVFRWLVAVYGGDPSWYLLEEYPAQSDNRFVNQFAADWHSDSKEARIVQGITSWQERQEALEEWLITAWEAGADPNQVRLALQKSGWQLGETDWTAGQFYAREQPYKQWHNLDMDGDSRDEWLMQLCLLGYEHGHCWGHNYWLISQGEIVLRDGYEDLSGLTISEGATIFTDYGDMTGDGRPEVVLESKSCGSGGCTSFFQILSGQSGTIHQLIHSLQMSYATAVLEDQTGDGLLDLVAHGQPFGGHMVGPRRGLTAVWSWTDRGVRRVLYRQEPSVYRVHLLYEANNALHRRDDLMAELLYLQVITDASLEDSATYWGDKRLSDYDDSRRFAVFQLILLYLRQGNSSEAAAWRDWLLTTYPDAPLTAATQQLLSEWELNYDLAAACTLITRQFASDDLTGELLFMGYGNPGLDNGDLCPID